MDKILFTSEMIKLATMTEMLFIHSKPESIMKFTNIMIEPFWKWIKDKDEKACLRAIEYFVVIRKFPSIDELREQIKLYTPKVSTNANACLECDDRFEVCAVNMETFKIEGFNCPKCRKSPHLSRTWNKLKYNNHISIADCIEEGITPEKLLEMRREKLGLK